MTQRLVNLIREAEALSVDEKKLLAQHLTAQTNTVATKLRWSDICGAVAAPLTGEDAQAWVSRTRREDQEARDRK